MKKHFKVVGFLGLFAILAFGKIAMSANLEDVTNVKKLELDGALHFGDSQDPAYNTMPTVLTADKFGVKVPFYNGSAVSTARGSVIIASMTATGTLYGSMTTTVGTTTVLGISDGIYATGTKGFMTIAGYAAVLTTGTITPGQLLISTVTIGYAGPVTSSGTLNGSVIGKTQGTAGTPTGTGNLVITLLGL